MMSACPGGNILFGRGHSRIVKPSYIVWLPETKRFFPMLLEKIHSPSDLRALSQAELDLLCHELRGEIIAAVGRHGGHLASNLGTVELSVALHRVFEVPHDALIFDVGHQAYAHKLLTGRAQSFRDSLRRFGGCSGFASPQESLYDCGVSGHSGTAISLATGLAMARRKTGRSGKVIALVGDGSLSNGISFEGLNAGGEEAENLIVLLNDNQMSISANVGALSRCLHRIISGGVYNRFKRSLRRFFRRWPSLKKSYLVLRRLESSIKYLFLPPGIFFQELGYRYLGPVNGHHLPGLLRTFQSLKELPGPVLLHVITRKGQGCDYACKNPALYHGLEAFKTDTGKIKDTAAAGFAGTLCEQLCQMARQDGKLELISPAMLLGSGLCRFQDEFPLRCHDVGIAEEHAVVFSAGLALGGSRPVCVLYSTFAQRALDCIYHDVLLAELPVLFIIDRAGVVEDGPTHHGIYDLGFLRALPGLTIMAPRDEEELKLMLHFAYGQNRSMLIRYPKGKGARHKNLPRHQDLALGKAEVIQAGSGPVLWSMGPEIDTAFRVSELYEAETGESCMLVNARFISPFDQELARSLAQRPMLSIENHRDTGGLASALAESLAGLRHAPLLHYGWPDQIIVQGDEQSLRKHYGLRAEDICADMLQKLKTNKGQP